MKHVYVCLAASEGFSCESEGHAASALLGKEIFKLQRESEELEARPCGSPPRRWAPTRRGAYLLTSSLMAPLQVQSWSFLRGPAAFSKKYNLLTDQRGLSARQESHKLFAVGFVVRSPQCSGYDWLLERNIEWLEESNDFYSPTEISLWWVRVCLKLQSVLLIPTPCCLEIPSQLNSVFTSGST